MMNRNDIQRQIEELKLEVPIWEKTMPEEAARVNQEIELFTKALTMSDDQIRKCQSALPGRASILRMAKTI